MHFDMISLLDYNILVQLSNLIIKLYFIKIRNKKVN